MYPQGIRPFWFGLKLPKRDEKLCLKLFKFSGDSIEFQATVSFSITFL